jgi:demethylmenaquinone methyltransferase/2-methoxy-6-polyprenyl-1,4-benzoquinol methylase
MSPKRSVCCVGATNSSVESLEIVDMTGILSCRHRIRQSAACDGNQEIGENVNRPRIPADKPVRTDDGPSRERVWEMFDRVAPTYDLLNRLLSAGCDIGWRRRLAAHLPNGSDLAVLDLATGTGDILLTLAETGRTNIGVGLDMASAMLRRGREKSAARGWSDRITWIRADAGKLPIGSGTFDVVTIAFGIRNFVAVERSLAEIHRVLKPGGRLLILEFSLPENALVRRFYLFYLRHVLPLVGRIISGDRYAYRYLDRTIEAFPYGDAFCRLMNGAGLVRSRALPLTMGVATLYQADKDPETGLP